MCGRRSSGVGKKFASARTGISIARRTAKVRVVVVVPRRHRIDGGVARIEHGAVRPVEQRPRAARDQHRLDRVGQAEVLRVDSERPPRAARRRHPTAGSSSARPPARRASRPAAPPAPETAPGRSRRPSGCRCPRPSPSWPGSPRRSGGSRTQSRPARDRSATRPRALARRACRSSPWGEHLTTPGACAPSAMTALSQSPPPSGAEPCANSASPALGPIAA